MAIDQTIIDNLGAATLRGVLRQSDLADQASRDMSSLLMFDHRSLSAAIAREVAEAPDPGAIADFNSVSHVPTAQPFVSPNVYSPTGGPPGQTPPKA
jgi:hypothetical protein